MPRKPLQEWDIMSGSRFRKACERVYGYNLSNVEMAKKIGCSEAAIRNWYNGAPLNGIIINLLSLQGISKDYLISGKPPMHPKDDAFAQEIFEKVRRETKGNEHEKQKAPAKAGASTTEDLRVKLGAGIAHAQVLLGQSYLLAMEGHLQVADVLEVLEAIRRSLQTPVENATKATRTPKAGA
jgi:hypothetical protein